MATTDPFQNENDDPYFDVPSGHLDSGRKTLRRVPRIERLADALADTIARGSADYGAKRNVLKKLFLEFAEEVRRND